MSPPTPLARVGMAVWLRRHPEWRLPPDGHVQPDLELTLRTLPRYAIDQGRLALGRRRHGIEGRPWLTADSIDLLEGLLRPGDVVLEFGSGGSTAWLAGRVGRVYSVEASDAWHAAVLQQLARAGCGNVTYALASVDTLGRGTAEHRSAYVAAHPQLGPASVDVVLVDGEYRDECVLRGLDVLRPGGVLIVDNANTYLPSATRTPWKVHRPASAGWATFTDAVAGWRHVWTTNGAWDTALWFKP